jgi:hypothetical protein
MSFTFQQIQDKLYTIQFDYKGKQIEFQGIVANDDSEIGQLVEAQIAFMENGANVSVPSYADKRRQEYPPMQDYMDGLVKGDQAQMQAYINQCLAVKAKYPKG